MRSAFSWVLSAAHRRNHMGSLMYIRLANLFPFLCGAVLGIVLFVPAVGWGVTATILVHKTAIVRGSHITIGDVATIRGGSARMNAKVRDIVIGHAPPAGQERILYGAYIITRLKQHGLNTEGLQIKAPAKIRITRASQRIESRDIEATVTQAIQAEMPWEPRQVAIRSLRGVESVILPQGPVRSEVSFPVNTDFLGPTSFTVSFRVAGNIEKRLYGSANIEVTQEVVTTTRALARHEVITAADLRMTRVNLARLPRRVLMKPDDVIGKRAKRALQAHALIHAYEVETLPLVRKGDAVLILVESPLLKVSTMGEALEHGQRGDTIRVRNVSSQRNIRAVVVDEKTVRVPF